MPNNGLKKKVIICGAGIGGLTAAHELSARGFDVTIYERHPIVGGLARSSYYTDHKNGHTYPSEYSWRVYGTEYNNLLRILHEIPLHGQQKNSVYDNLIQVLTYIFPRFNKHAVLMTGGKHVTELIDSFTKKDLWSVLNKTFLCLTMSKKRIDSCDSLSWKEFCKDLTPEAKKYLVTMWGPVLGMDPTHMSFPVVARMVKILLAGLLGDANALYLMNKPTNDGWFDEWTHYLQTEKGVTIKTNHQILDYTIADRRVQNVIVLDSATGKHITDEADYVICALSVESIADIVYRNKALSNVPTLKNTITLSNICRQIQLSVQIFLDKKIHYPTPEKNILYLPDTPWAIIIEPQDVIWEQTYASDPRVKSVWSVGICQTDVPGIIHQKPFTECSKEEIQAEVWAQIVRSYAMSNIKTESGENIDQAHIILFYIWDSFGFDREKKRFDTWEPKFSNNANSLQYQPAPITEIPNFFFATAYTKTDRYIYSMEAAAEAGILAANAIITRHNADAHTSLSLSKTYPLSISPLLLRPLVIIDNLLFSLGLPHLSRLFFGSSVALVSLFFAVPVLLVFYVVLK